MPGRQPEKNANSPHRGRPRDAEVDAAAAAYQTRCDMLLQKGDGSDPVYAAGVRHAALKETLSAFNHPGLRAALLSRCRRAGIPLPPRGRPGAAALAVEAVLVAIWRFERDPTGDPRIVALGERWRPLLPEHPSPAQQLIWRERAHVRRINALPPDRRRSAILRLAAQSRPTHPA